MHADQLHMALAERQLEGELSESTEQFMEWIQAGKVDALVEASTNIARTVILAIGVQNILNYCGCAVCAIQNIIPLEADRIAAQRRPRN